MKGCALVTLKILKIKFEDESRPIDTQVSFLLFMTDYLKLYGIV